MTFSLSTSPGSRSRLVDGVCRRSQQFRLASFHRQRPADDTNGASRQIRSYGQDDVAIQDETAVGHLYRWRFGWPAAPSQRRNYIYGTCRQT